MSVVKKEEEVLRPVQLRFRLHHCSRAVGLGPGFPFFLFFVEKPPSHVVRRLSAGSPSYAASTVDAYAIRLRRIEITDKGCQFSLLHSTNVFIPISVAFLVL